MTFAKHICKYIPAEVLNLYKIPKCVVCGKPLPNPPITAMHINFGGRYKIMS